MESVAADHRRIVLAGLTYFALVFGAGFVLGPIRVLLLVPRLGERWAELLEMPVMAVVITFAAGWVVRRFGVPPRSGARIAMGGLALGLVLGAEFGLVLWLRGMSLREYFAARDPVAGAAYCALLLAMLLWPLWVGGPRPAAVQQQQPVDAGAAPRRMPGP